MGYKFSLHHHSQTNLAFFLIHYIINHPSSPSYFSKQNNHELSERSYIPCLFPTHDPILCHLYSRYVWKSSAFFSKYLSFSVMGARSSSKVIFISEDDADCGGAEISHWGSVLVGEMRQRPGLQGLRFRLPSGLEVGTSTEPSARQLYPCSVAIFELLSQYAAKRNAGS